MSAKLRTITALVVVPKAGVLRELNKAFSDADCGVPQGVVQCSLLFVS